MRFYIQNVLCPEEEASEEMMSCPVIEVLSDQDYLQRREKQSPQRRSFVEKIRHCKVDFFGNFIRGSLSVPERRPTETARWSCLFFFDKNNLLFVGEKERIVSYLQQIAGQQTAEIHTPAQAFFEFLEVLVSQEGEFIDNYGEELQEREDNMMANVTQIPRNFEHYILKTRKELSVFSRYYRQMAELGRLLSDCPNKMIEEETQNYFRFFAGRLERLAADAQELREYCLQLRDMYQTRIDIRQNRNMQILTVVTAIFMPLTLITGWYGMNFVNMPELTWQYGYGMVIVLAGGLLLLEWLLYKKKKWF